MAVSGGAILLAIVGPLVALLVLLPVAVLAAAWLIYGLIMALRELWKDE